MESGASRSPPLHTLHIRNKPMTINRLQAGFAAHAIVDLLADPAIAARVQASFGRIGAQALRALVTDLEREYNFDTMPAAPV